MNDLYVRKQHQNISVNLLLATIAVEELELCYMLNVETEKLLISIKEGNDVKEMIESSDYVLLRLRSALIRMKETQLKLEEILY